MNEDQSIVTNEEQQEKSALDQLTKKLISLRESRGMTIERVAMATKISLPFIISLEKGELDKLPESVFTRGFIRNMCKLYEVDANVILDQFDAVMAEKNGLESTKDEEGGAQRTRHRRRQRKKRLSYRSKKSLNFGVLKPVPFLVLAAGVLVGIVVSYYLITRNKVSVSSRKSQTPVPVTASQPPKPIKAEPAAELSTEEVQIAKNVDLQAEDLISGEDGQIVEIIVKTSVKITIAKDGGGWVTETLKPDSYQYRFQDQLNLYVYDADAVDVSYNGKKLGKLGAKGSVKRLSFRLKDEIDSHQTNL